MRKTLRQRAIFEKKCIALYGKEFSTRAIAAKLGCSQGKVWKTLARAGVPRRSRSEAITVSHRWRGHRLSSTNHSSAHHA